MPDRAPSLQEQIVELRMRLEQQGEGQAALIEHVARREVQHALKDAVPTPDELRRLREMLDAQAKRRAVIHDVMVHLAKWGGSGVVGYIAFSVWEQFKRGKAP